MRTKKVLLLTFIVFLALTPLTLSQGKTVVSNDLFEVTITINDAYYYAADADGIENDVAVKFSLDVVDISPYYHSNYVVSFYLLTALHCPSGNSHEYLYQVYCVLDTHETPTIYFYNHAVEAGWYCVEITCFLHYCRNCYVYGSEYFDFDPPGGDEGAGGPLQCEIEL